MTLVEQVLKQKRQNYSRKFFFKFYNEFSYNMSLVVLKNTKYFLVVVIY